LGGTVTLYPGTPQKEIEIWTELQYGKGDFPLISADLKAKFDLCIAHLVAGHQLLSC
jgi:hypothetical protein